MAQKATTKKHVEVVETKTPSKPVEAKKDITQNMSDSILSYSDDINEAEAPPPLPAKTYTARIEGATKKVSTNSGNTYVALTLRIPPDEYPADFTTGSEDGEIVNYNRLVYDNTPRGRYLMRKFLETVGVRANGGEVDLNELVGRGVGVVIEHQMYEGENRAQVAKLVTI